MSLGIILPNYIASIMRVLLCAVPLYLFFGFKKFLRRSYIVALYYHCFFIINSALSIAVIMFENSPVKPILQIIARPEFGIPMEDLSTLTLRKSIVYSLNIFVGIIVVYYLTRKKDLFEYGR